MQYNTWSTNNISVAQYTAVDSYNDAHNYLSVHEPVSITPHTSFNTKYPWYLRVDVSIICVHCVIHSLQRLRDALT